MRASWAPTCCCPGSLLRVCLWRIIFWHVSEAKPRDTVAAFFGERFASPEVQQIAGLDGYLGVGGYLLVVTQGAALLLSDLTGVSYAAAF